MVYNDAILLHEPMVYNDAILLHEPMVYTDAILMHGMVLSINYSVFITTLVRDGISHSVKHIRN